MAKGIVTEIELSAFEQRPGNVLSCQPPGEAIGFEGATIKHTVIDVDLGDQLVLDVCPTLPEEFEHRHVDRCTGVLHCRGGRHVPAAQQCPRQVECRHHGGQ